MANAACAMVDPIFFLHHCNIDRLWAEWQDSGHYGSMYAFRDAIHLVWLIASFFAAFSLREMTP